MTDARTIGPGEVPDVVATLADAFVHDPVLAFLFDDADRRPAQLAALFANRLAAGSGFDEVFVPTDPDGLRRCAALWVGPHEPDDAEAAAAEAGAANRALLEDAGAMERLSRLFPIFQSHPRTPHWYLAFVGTREAARGLGLASACIGAVTARCDVDGLGAYLESSDPDNVPLYERHGFVVTGEVAVDGGPTVPLMWRDPR